MREENPLSEVKNATSARVCAARNFDPI